jgi:peptidoglycan/LPS O-acetylase OafA/YrhL
LFDKTYFNGAYLAVEFFFIISGFFIAAASAKARDSVMAGHDDLGRSFVSLQLGRFRKLAPVFLFAMAIFAVIFYINGNHSYGGLSKYLMSMIFMNNEAAVRVVPGGWFLHELFWVGALVSAIVMFCRRRAPLILAAVVSGMLWYGGYLGYNDAFWKSLDLRAVFDLSLGALLWFLAPWLNEKITIKNWAMPAFEIGALALLWVIFHNNDRTNDFAVFPVASFLVVTLYYKRESFLRFMSWRGFRPFAKITFMMYLTHLVLVEQARGWAGQFAVIGRDKFYIAMLAASIIVAFVAQLLFDRIMLVIRRIAASRKRQSGEYGQNA